MKDDTDHVILIYWVSGNPGTGSNFFSVIHEDGSVTAAHAPYFLLVVKAFGKMVNKHRKTVNGKAPYILEQVVEMLLAEKQSVRETKRKLTNGEQ